jgi:WD40 repeat protein
VSNDETIAVWDARSYGKLSVFREEHKVACVTYSPDGTLLASGNEAYGVKIRDAQSGKLLSVLKVHTGNVRAVAFSANGQTLASGGNDCLVRLWNVATGEELFTLPTKAPINGLAFDRESRTLAAALHDGTVVEWSGDHERALE